MAQGWVQIVVFLVVLTALVPLARRLHRQGLPGRTGLPVPRLRANRALHLQGACACGPTSGQDWKAYARSIVVFSLLSWLLLYLILRTQSIQPFNPEGFDSGPWNLSFNTTSSFVTNTNWQYYGGETTLSYFAQMAGLTVQNFVSAAVGIAALAAVIRGFAARSAHVARQLLGRPGPDLLYILLPISFVAALVLVSQGVIQTLDGSQTFHTIAGGTQTLALGPVASQEAIKELGTNGGGFFNVNSAYPVRELERLHQLRRAAADPDHPGQPHLHLRPHDRQPAPGLGALRGDDADVHRRRRASSTSPSSTAPPRSTTPVSSPTPSTAPPAATWRARSSASGSPIRRCGRRSRRSPPAAPSTPPSTR